jgi:hypothetical protein
MDHQAEMPPVGIMLVDRNNRSMDLTNLAVRDWLVDSANHLNQQSNPEQDLHFYKMSVGCF